MTDWTKHLQVSVETEQQARHLKVVAKCIEPGILCKDRLETYDKGAVDCHIMSIQESACQPRADGSETMILRTKMPQLLFSLL